MSRTYGNKTPVRYTDRTRQTIAEDWNDVSTDVENILGQISTLSSTVDTSNTNTANQIEDILTQISDLSIVVENLSLSSKTGVVTAEDIEVFDVSQGVYVDDNIIAAGTSLESILKNMLQKVVHPTYNQPSCFIGSNISYSNYRQSEVGTSINDLLNIGWTQNDAGSLTGYSILKDSNEVFSGSNIQNNYNAGEIVIGNDNSVFEINVSYNEGEGNSTNNIGEEDPHGKVEAGTISDSITFFGGNRRVFFRCDDSKIYPQTEVDLRQVGYDDEALTAPHSDQAIQDIINWNKNKNIEISFPASWRIVIAYPASLGTLNAIEDINLFDMNIAESFTFRSILVNGANNKLPTPYNTYTFIPDQITQGMGSDLVLKIN